MRKEKRLPQKNRSSLPWISLLKCGGAIRGTSERFSANSVIGTRPAIVSICTGRARAAFGPQLTLSAYALAASAVGGAVGATLGLASTVKHTSTLFFFAVVLSSWFGGVGPGIFAVLLSAIALDYYFIPPIYALGISVEEAPDMIVFAASAVFVSWLNRGGKWAKYPVRRARVESDAKVRHRSVELGKTREPLDTEPSAQNMVQQGLIQENTEAARVACMRTAGELADPITRVVSGNIEEVEKLEFSDQPPPAEKVQETLLDGVREPLAHPLTLHPGRESIFFRHGDYWTIQYEGQIAQLKATRGLHCLASLLRHPGREFHVNELLAEMPVAAVAHLASGTPKEDRSQMRTARFQDAGPILDARAKAEYARRLADLRGELEDAERLNDPERAGRAQQEMDSIADQLAAAVGLGGRNRRAASQAERARSAVTKRIKDSIEKIAEALPPLGRHLATTVKTGYFCSYNRHPGRPVEWKVRP
jgi:hypothetical protein